MIGGVLKGLLAERGTNVSELARKTGISPQTLYSIIKRDNMKVDLEVLIAIGDALEVPLEMFCKGTKLTEVWQCLTESEQIMLKRYRKMDVYGRELVHLVMEKEIQRAENQKTKADL